jgi:glycosyltransferase involved in cell wall biosynthesis
MPPRPSISAVFPAFNDGGTIASVFLRAQTALEEITDDYEVIITDDGSEDYTREVLEELAGRFPCLRVLHHSENRGYGHALRTGFAAATKELVFYTDGDAQYDPHELGVLYRALDDDVDIVNGYKISRHDPWYRVVIGRLYHHLMRLAFKLPIRDVDCDFRLIRRRCLQAVALEAPDGTLPLEMVTRFTRAGFRFAEVPVHHFHRAYGRSQFFNLRRLVRVSWHVAKLWWRLVARGGPAPSAEARPRAPEASGEH